MIRLGSLNSHHVLLSTFDVAVRHRRTSPEACHMQPSAAAAALLRSLLCRGERNRQPQLGS